jgi:hypothetical protein
MELDQIGRGKKFPRNVCNFGRFRKIGRKLLLASSCLSARLSVRLSVRMEQFDFHWTDFYEI